MAVVFIFAMGTTALAGDTADIIYDQSDITSEPSHSPPTESAEPSAKPEDSEEDGTEEPEADDTTEPSASASPDPTVSSDPAVSGAPEEELLLDIVPMMLVPGADVTVLTWDDFKESVEQAEVDGKVIRLDANLAGTMPAALTMNITHNNSVVIDGGGNTFTAPSGAKAFTFNNTGSGSITLQNMTLDGTGGAGGMVSFTGSSFTLSGLTLSNISGTAVTTSGANATLNGVTIDTATNGITGSGSLSVTDSTFKTIATNAIVAGSGNVVVTDTTIDGVTSGKGIQAGAGTLDVTGSTLKNITGNGIAGGNGAVTIDNTDFLDINGVGLSGGSNAVVKNTLFENVRNNLGGHGSAIYCAGNLTVEDSSFVNSASTIDGGYIQGAIVAFGGMRNVNITRSYFKDNKASRYGGAIGFYQFAGDVNISHSYFEGNGVSGKGASSDGGAIGVFNSNSGSPSTINLDNNTFIGNTAQDDGSAYFAESRNNSTVSTLTNNTFYGNKSTKYILSVADSGGVVQLSLDTVGHFKNNTFIGNSTSSSGTHGQGSAVGQHIDSANSGVRPTATFQNNIMIGNGGTNNAYRNVNITNATDLGGNVGYDNGTALAASVTANAVFGSSPQPQSYSSVGKDGYKGPLSTVAILPNDGISGLADNVAGAPVLSRDARGYARDSANSDAGSMEIKFVRFDANGGAWSGLSSLTYSGSKYYADETASTGYFLVTNPGGSISVLTGDLPTNGTKTFDGWYTEAIGGTKVTGSTAAKDQTLYAHWTDAAVQYTITYDGNGSDSGSVPAQETYNSGDPATIADSGTMGKTDATFTGWNTLPNGTGVPYTAGQTFTITGNLELYAQWEDAVEPIALYALDFDSQGGTPVDSITDIPAGTHVAEPTAPTRDGHTFDGWHNVPNCTCDHATPCWDFARDTVDGDKVLYARWQPVAAPVLTFTVDFDSQGGSAVNAITDIVPGSRIAAPANPTRDGYIFRGWYQEKECANYWFFDYYDVNESRTLYAKWEAAPISGGNTDTETTGTTSGTASGTTKTGDTSVPIVVLVIAAAGAAAVIIRTVTALKKREASK